MRREGLGTSSETRRSRAAGGIIGGNSHAGGTGGGVAGVLNAEVPCGGLCFWAGLVGQDEDGTGDGTGDADACCDNAASDGTPDDDGGGGVEEEEDEEDEQRGNDVAAAAAAAAAVCCEDPMLCFSAQILKRLYLWCSRSEGDKS